MLNNLFSLIQKSVSECYKCGIDPSEIWIGPTESEYLKHYQEHQKKEGMLVSTSQKGMTIFGLTVRFMVEDGVRAGTSK